MEKIKCSLIIPVLESYEAVRRQMIYMNNIGIPDYFEVILVDDGSRPPIMGQRNVAIPEPNFKFKYVYRGDYRPYTKACALNDGSKAAEGEYVWIFAIDFMISKGMIHFMKSYEDDLLLLPLCRFALLDENGKLEIIGKKKIYGHLGLAVVKKTQWDELGGFNRQFVGFYPSGDDIEFGARYYKKYGRDHFMYGPEIYMFPNEETTVCSWAMDDPEVKDKYKRPDIFYGDSFNEWKEAETKEYWKDYYDPNMSHPEKGFRKIKCNLQDLILK